MQLNSLDLVGFELHRSLAAEHRYEHFNFSALFVNLAHLALEIFERPVDNDDRIAFGEVDGVAHRVAFGALEDFVHLLLGERDGLIGGTHESGDLRRIAYHAPRVVGRYHVDKDVAGENLFFHFRLATVLYLDFLFYRYDDIENLLTHAEAINALFEIAGDRILIAGIRVHRVPLPF